MPRPQQEPTETDGRQTHPAFAVVRTARVSGEHSLFGSEVSHQHVIELTIATAHRRRDLNRDSVMGDEDLITIALSPAQWGELVSSTGVYQGTCATITRRDGALVPAIPYAPRINRNLQEIRQATARALADIAEAAEELSTAIESKAGIRAIREKLRDLQIAVSNAPANAAFAVTSLQEAAEQIIADTTAEIEARISQATSRGLAAANTMAALPSNETQAPAETTEDPS